MTDGQQSWSRDQIPLPDAVRPLIENGTLRYAVGIGSEISPVELNVIAGDNVVLAADFESLLGKLEEQIGLIGTDGCKGKRLLVCFCIDMCVIEKILVVLNI